MTAKINDYFFIKSLINYCLIFWGTYIEKGAISEKLKLPGTVTISSEPDGADVYLNDLKVGPTFFQDQLIAGDYTLSVRKNLYHTYTSSFKVKEGESKILDKITLLPNYGYLEVNSNIDETKITIDNKSYGTTPIAKKMFQSGQHTIKAEAEWYHTQEKTVTIIDLATATMKFDLKPAFGSMVINSEPEGAIVYIDGQQVGTTPYTDEKIHSSTYTVTVKKNLWADAEENVIVSDGQKTIKKIILSKNFGTLNITAKNSDIYLDGKPVGTNYYTAALKAGSYKIKAVSPKHKNAEKEIFISAGSTYNETLTPEPIMASLSVISNPEEAIGAEIFIDNQNTGKKTPAVLPLFIGNYNITLKKEKFLDATQNVTLTDGENKKLVLQMNSYAGSYLSKKNFWSSSQSISAGIIAADILLVAVLKSSANNNFEKYNNATTPEDAIFYKTRTNNLDKVSNITLSVNIAPILWYYVSNKQKNKYKKLL